MNTLNLTERLDELETSLPAIPANTLKVGRATVRRTTSVAASVLDDISERAGRVADTAGNAARTVSGQARSAGDRSIRTARSGANEVVGQARAQAERAAKVADDETSQALADAAEAAAPEPATRREMQAMSKADLYEYAQRLDLDGRSTMSKDELIDAIAHH